MTYLIVRCSGAICCKGSHLITEIFTKFQHFQSDLIFTHRNNDT